LSLYSVFLKLHFLVHSKSVNLDFLSVYQFRLCLSTTSLVLFLLSLLLQSWHRHTYHVTLRAAQGTSLAAPSTVAPHPNLPSHLPFRHSMSRLPEATHCEDGDRAFLLGLKTDGFFLWFFFFENGRLKSLPNPSSCFLYFIHPFLYFYKNQETGRL
jgi:hypothetical protein